MTSDADPIFFTDDSNEPRRRRAVYNPLEERHRSVQSRHTRQYRLFRASGALHGEFWVHMVRSVSGSKVVTRENFDDTIMLAIMTTSGMRNEFYVVAKMRNEMLLVKNPCEY